MDKEQNEDTTQGVEDETEEEDVEETEQGTQTANIFTPDITDTLAGRLLEYTPASEIAKGNNVAILNLPKKGQVVFSTDANVQPTFIDVQSQTSMTVTPHLLNSGDVAIVRRPNETQTDDKQEFVNIRETTPVSQIEKQIIEADIKEIIENTIDRVLQDDEIIGVMATTAKNLEEKLEKMMEEYGVDSKVKDKGIQNKEFAEHIPAGDGYIKRKPNILCECSCCGPCGNAVPLLGPMKCGSDLSKQIIRLSGNCKSRSEVIKPCSGMEEKTRCKDKPIAQNSHLLVDQDAEYADSYLEHLDLYDNEGVQANLSDEDNDDYYEELMTTSKAKLKKCKCINNNIEMPWDLLTYDPQEKEKIPQETSIKDLPVLANLSPSTVLLRELTVTACINKDLLLDIQNQIKSDTFAKENLEIDEIERQILEEVNNVVPEKITALEGCVPEDVSPSEDDEAEDIPITRLPTRKASPRQVFDPSCERHNEPYMDRMYRYFPDGCDNVDPCPSHIEMPWNSLILPKCCCIRKSFKLKPKSDVSATSSHSSYKNIITKSISKNKIDKKINMSDIASKIFTGTKGEIMIKMSGHRIPHKHTKKTVILQGSFSQPYLIQPYKVTKAPTTNSNESKEIKVHNLEKKSSKEEIKQHSSSVPAVCCTMKSSLNQKGEKNDSRTDRISRLLESCKKEMEPIKDGINQLRSRIRELNLPDISNYHEPPQRSGMPSEYNTNFPLISSYTSLMAPEMQYPCMPPWGWGCMPYYQMPCYHPPPNQGRSKPRPKIRRPFCNLDTTTSTGPESEDEPLQSCKYQFENQVNLDTNNLPNLDRTKQPNLDRSNQPNLNTTSSQLSAKSSHCNKCKHKASKIPKPYPPKVKNIDSKLVKIDTGTKDFQSQMSSEETGAESADNSLQLMTTEVKRNPENNNVYVVNKYRQPTKDVGCCSKHKDKINKDNKDNL